ncbi:hypothetical protein ACVWXX_002303 [Bacillus toyonensis]|nr:hypothetical protein IIO_03009 [Bacillus cereus VD115]EJV46191.1 hypothetical protein IEA_03426 [Bacillus toyonensis]EJV93698.1 hypothetical protein IGI_03416 [Bacillus toyonensis]EOP43379.1 hypothetical protein IKI_01269 [Bacillus toyonensis]
MELLMNKWVAGVVAFLVVGLGSWVFLWSDVPKGD